MAQIALYVVYKSPADYPGKYVVRKWLGETPEPEPLCVSTSLAEVHMHIPDYCICLSPARGDDPVILETWI